jgi:hypothetical protein
MCGLSSNLIQVGDLQVIQWDLFAPPGSMQNIWVCCHQPPKHDAKLSSSIWECKRQAVKVFLLNINRTMKTFVPLSACQTFFHWVFLA